MDVVTETQAAQNKALYSQPDILARGRFSKSHLYNLMARGQFPQPSLRCGPRFTRWNCRDVDNWMANPQLWIDANTTVTA